MAAPEPRRIRITGGPAARMVQVELDGVDISRYCQAVTWRASVKGDDAVAHVTLELIAAVEIEGLAEVNAIAV